MMAGWMAFARRPIVRPDLPLGSCCACITDDQTKVMWLEIVCRCGPDAEPRDRLRQQYAAIRSLWPNAEADRTELRELVKRYRQRELTAVQAWARMAVLFRLADLPLDAREKMRWHQLPPFNRTEREQYLFLRVSNPPTDLLLADGRLKYRVNLSALAEYATQIESGSEVEAITDRVFTAAEILRVISWQK